MSYIICGKGMIAAAFMLFHFFGIIREEEVASRPASSGIFLPIGVNNALQRVPITLIRRGA